MSFAHAGWCEACVAHDLLFARAIGSGRIFYVCAACTAAGMERPTSDLSPTEQSILHRGHSLAPQGWMLALTSELDRDSATQVEKEAGEDYEAVIAWYPGFHSRFTGG